MGYFLRLSCTWEESCESVWPPNSRLYASLTCTDLRLLAGPFDQGLSLLRSCQIMFTVGSLGRYIDRVSVECRSIADRYIDQESVDGRSTLGRWSVDRATDYRPTIGRYCADPSRSNIGQISAVYLKVCRKRFKKVA